MKKIGLFLALALALCACAPAPAPSPTQDVQATINALSGTMIAATLTAQPSITPQPSATLQPTSTTTPTPQDTSTPAATSTPEATATAWSGTFSPGSTDGLPVGFLRIENLTGEKEIIVTLKGVTLTRDVPVYYAYKVTGALLLTILWARYEYIIQVPNKHTFTGTFTQGNKDKTTIRVYLNKDPVIVGP